MPYGFFRSSDDSNISGVIWLSIFFPIIMLIAASCVRLFGPIPLRPEKVVHAADRRYESSTIGHVPISGLNASRTFEAIFLSADFCEGGSSYSTMKTKFDPPLDWQESTTQPPASMWAARSVRTTALPVSSESRSALGSYGIGSAGTNTSIFVPSNPVNFSTIRADCIGVNCLGPKISSILFTRAIRSRSALSASSFASLDCLSSSTARALSAFWMQVSTMPIFSSNTNSPATPPATSTAAKISIITNRVDGFSGTGTPPRFQNRIATEYSRRSNTNSAATVTTSMTTPATTKNVQKLNQNSRSDREVARLDSSISSALNSEMSLHEHALRLATLQLIVVIVAGTAGIMFMLAIALGDYFKEKKMCHNPSRGTP